MARTRASSAPGAAEHRRAARRDVFNNEALLERVLSCGHMSANDVASAALVSRLWSRVAAGDGVWRPIWLREARSLRHLENRIAAPAGVGFRAAVAQLRAAALLSHEPEWRLEDYTVAIDISWRGEPLFSAHRELSDVDFDDSDDENLGVLHLTNLLQADESFAPLCLRALQKACSHEDADSLFLAASTVKSSFALRILVQRSDGAVACLVDGAECSDFGRSTALTERLQQYAMFWNSEGFTPSYAIAEDDSSLAFAVYWSARCAVGPGGEGSEPFSCCELYFELAHNVDLELTEELLLSSMPWLKWITPSGPMACASAAQARQWAADAGELTGGSDDDSGDE